MSYAPGESSATGYAAVQLLEYALNQGATSRSQIIDKLSAGKDMPTIFGPFTYSSTHGAASLSSLALLVVKNGAFVANPKQFPAN